jgi:hypothetical protein
VADSSSRIDGSEGGGLSSAHLRDSYLERMNDSILLELAGIELYLRSQQRMRHTAQGGHAQLSNEPPNTSSPVDSPISQLTIKSCQEIMLSAPSLGQ